jgi:serine/threonine-protein kinase
LIRINSDFILKNFPEITQADKIAKGGQKVVYKAVHSKFGNVAFKVISDIDDVRIKREIDILTSIRIVNVPKLYEWNIIEIDGDKSLYMIEEYLEGKTLRAVINENGILSVRFSLEVLRALLVAIFEMEKLGLVHRDIKPENLIIGDNGIVYLLDFGIARDLNKSSITFTHQAYGPHTPGYAAPEQFRNMKKDIDSRCDLFSAGVVAYEIFKGKHPFVESPYDHPIDILNKTETVTPDPLIIIGDTQKQLAGFINILIDKLPTRRPRNAETALKWFNALLPTLSIEED